ncbi:MAG TPA: suppressor of fused domain protein [Fimbriimonadaceae bacterium]|nr:hypothetical protein [Armatimonadota bacterium]HCM72893.1 hypothetical protein [Armatimonadota bacterium]HRD32180.1 suppressor of fused domain protein [Fimbriimonadaceae bacterium]HRE94618.1 suppressor of fused domain protein [Fimbriimonadaceae bacterium]HRI74733.1 suppressor of fused domain protein [Fimbriimonadaceae bacterium]
MGFLKRLFPGKNRTHYLSNEEIDGISAHFAKHVGPVNEMVLHEIVSDALHIDLHVIPDVPGHDCAVVFTTGMSALPMPRVDRDMQFAELFVVLPKAWVEGNNLQTDEGYWPLGMLKTMARMPIYNKIPVYPGISIPNGDPAEEFPGTPFTGVLLDHGDIFGKDFARAEIEGKPINFYGLMPMRREEMDFKASQKQAHIYFAALMQLGVTDREKLLIDPQRPSFFDRIPDKNPHA